MSFKYFNNWFLQDDLGANPYGVDLIKVPFFQNCHIIPEDKIPSICTQTMLSLLSGNWKGLFYFLFLNRHHMSNSPLRRSGCCIKA